MSFCHLSGGRQRLPLVPLHRIKFYSNLRNAERKARTAVFITYTVYVQMHSDIHSNLFLGHWYLWIPKEIMEGVEHGSSKWGDGVSEVCRRYCEKQYTNNLLLTQHFPWDWMDISINGNLNVLVSRKFRGRKEPDLCDSEHHAVQLLDGDHRSSGTSAQNRGILERNGYEVRVLI